MRKEYFYFWYFKYVLMLILLYFSLSMILNAELLLVTSIFATFTEVKYLNISSCTGSTTIVLLIFECLFLLVFKYIFRIFVDSPSGGRPSSSALSLCSDPVTLKYCISPY